MLGQRRRRWTNIKPALGHRSVFSGWGHFNTKIRRVSDVWASVEEDGQH